MSLPGEILQGIVARWALVLLRVYLGMVFLVAALPKIQSDQRPAPLGVSEQVALDRGHPFYQGFAERVIRPNATAFAAVVTWGELLVGITLVLGLLTRLAAAVALLLALNNMFAEGAWFWTPSSNDAAFIAIAVALLLGAAGRTLGLDAFLAKRWPRSPFW